MMHDSDSDQRDAQRQRPRQLHASPRGFSAYTRSVSTASAASPRNPIGSASHDPDAQQSASACGPVLGASPTAGSGVSVPLGNVQGRVFERLARFRLLPPALRLQSDAAVAYLLSPVVFHTVFSAPSALHRALCWTRNALRGRHAELSTSRNPRVSGARLLRYLRRYLQVASGAGTRDADAAQQLAHTLLLGGLLAPEQEKKRRFVGSELAAAPPDDGENLQVADDRAHLYELVAPGARSLEPSVAKHREDDVVSVWDVADGAIRAGFVFRKPPSRSLGLQSSCCSDSNVEDAASTTGERELPQASDSVSRAREHRVYAVINGPCRHALAIFSDDVARASIAYVPLRDAIVQYVPSASAPSSQRRGPLLYHGLQVVYQSPAGGSSESRSETLDFVTKRAQESWLRTLLDAGAVYREVHAALAAWGSPSASFYSLTASRPAVTRDCDVLRFETLRDRVVLVVNVPTKDSNKRVDVGEQLRQLAELADRFGPDGLSVLVFPCSQFSDCDEDCDNNVEAVANEVADELGEQVEDASRDAGASQFVQVLAPSDVNGPDASEAFLFLNARLPGRFGPCVDGDYCKFVVSRGGEPVARLPPVTTDEELEASESDLVRVIREQLER